MPATRRALPAAVSAALLAVLAGALPAQAHNAKVHLAMTDRAYEIMIALSTGALPTSGDAALAQLAVDAGKAIPKLQALPAGLPPPRQALCIDPEVIKRHGQNPAWGGAGRFEDIALGSVHFPLALEYITGNDCGIDPFWSPGAFFDTVNVVPPGTPHGHRDHTGQVLGFWAHQPDDEEDDWHLFLVRPSNAAGFSEIKDYIETAGGAGAGAVWVTVRCAMECIGDVLGLGGDCEECLDEAIADAENAVHEGITTVDGLLPGFGDISDAALLSGMGHHLNVVPGAPADYDDLAGLFFEAAGPAGQPDPVELLATMVTDAAGTTVRYDESDGPKEYEIADGRD